MARKTTAERGYGADHQAERTRWEPKVKAGLVDCHAEECLEPSRWITPGSDWHLGHMPDRTGWTGPEHPRCNTSEGGKRGAAVTNGRPVPLRTSRAW